MHLPLHFARRCGGEAYSGHVLPPRPASIGCRSISDCALNPPSQRHCSAHALTSTFRTTLRWGSIFGSCPASPASFNRMPLPHRLPSPAAYRYICGLRWTTSAFISRTAWARRTGGGESFKTTQDLSTRVQSPTTPFQVRLEEGRMYSLLVGEPGTPATGSAVRANRLFAFALRP